MPDITAPKQVQVPLNIAVEVSMSFVHQKALLQRMSNKDITQMKVIQSTKRPLNTCVHPVIIAQAMDSDFNARQEDMVHHLVSLIANVTVNANQAISANQEAPPRFNPPAAMQQYTVLKPRLFPSLSTRDTIQHLKFTPSLPTMLGPTQLMIFNVNAKWGTGVTTASSSTALKGRMGMRLDQATWTSASHVKKVSTAEVSLPLRLQRKRRLSAVMRQNIAPKVQPSHAMLIWVITHSIGSGKKKGLRLNEQAK
mmetsp:Transcript_19698/g.33615  ORF Transcript_19698/g.33615 Transcript_19698/m.33615 type:complete len:253 (+) Transcript_19698:181-939(+)